MCWGEDGVRQQKHSEVLILSILYSCPSAFTLTLRGATEKQAEGHLPTCGSKAPAATVPCTVIVTDTYNYTDDCLVVVEEQQQQKKYSHRVCNLDMVSEDFYV